MPIFSDSFRSPITSFKDPFKSPLKGQPLTDTGTEDPLESFISPSEVMAGSPGPFIKDEPEDWQNNQSRFLGSSGFDMHQQFGGQNFGNSHGDFGAVNPSDLSMNANFNNHFGSQNMSSSFIMGNSNITDDELLDLNTTGLNHGQQGFSQGPGNAEGLSLNTSGSQMNQMYSHTPDGNPIQSPFINSFTYNQLHENHGNQQGFQSMPAGNVQSTSFDVQARARNKMPHALERSASDSRSPLTPKAAAMGNLHIGTPDSGSFPSHHVMGGQMGHRHQKSASSQWDHTPGSGPHSWIDSPNQSPITGSMHHPQISEVMATKHASLPAKMEGQGTHTGYQSQEQKRRKRRESHNQVERRRRDNINERIQDLSKLVPQHRLEDEKVRKHIHNNGPLSPSMTASGISPPHATSLLAGPNGRRAAGSITQGLPIEDKEKGPNKGDILNGAVSWTRDLMWMLYQKLQQEEEMKKAIADLGGTWPSETREDDSRMRTELIDAVERNGRDKFAYSRGPGSGLRVPKHTNVAGEPLTSSASPQSLSPALQSGGSGSNTGNTGHQQTWSAQYSSNNGQDPYMLKEEDEFGMEMN